MQHNIRTSCQLMRLLLLGTLLLCLSACGTQPVRVASPTTDLQILQLGVHTLTEPREVAGPIKHPDEAEKNGQLMAVATDLDDLAWLDEKDKVRVRSFVDQAVILIAQGRAEACSWWNLACRHRRRASLAPLASPPAQPPGQP